MKIFNGVYTSSRQPSIIPETYSGCMKCDKSNPVALFADGCFTRIQEKSKATESNKTNLASLILRYFLLNFGNKKGLVSIKPGNWADCAITALPFLSTAFIPCNLQEDYKTHLASQNTTAITLPAEHCVLNLLGLGNPGPSTEDGFLFISLKIMDQVSSTVTRLKRKLSPYDMNRFNSPLLTGALVVIANR